MVALVTGGCGFIGSHLVASLVKSGVKVRVLDDLSTGRRGVLPQGVELIEADIVTEGVFHAALEGVEQVFHLAAIASVPRTVSEWHRTHQVNVGGLVNLFDAVSRTKRHIPVVFASSAAVYGNAEHLPVSEQSPTTPESAYGVDKLSCEWHGKVAEGLHSIPNIGLRFFNVYGPGQDPKSPYSGVISIFMERAAQGKPLVIYGDGTQSRDFVFVADVVNTVRAAMNALLAGRVRHGVFNVGTGNAVSIAELAREISRLSGAHVPVENAPARSGDILHSYCSNTLAGKVLGYLPVTALPEGLAQTYKVFSP